MARWALLALALVPASLAAKVFATGHAASPPLAIVPTADGLLRFAGFGIDEVVLTGHKQTADRDIFEALDLVNARSLASLDTGGVRRRLERLPWIASAEIMRIWPNRLEVRVKERRPMAVWRVGGREHLIDETGRVLTEIHRSTGLALPRISGEGAQTEAKALLDALARHPRLAGKVEEAERIGARRWSLTLSGGVILHLPPDQEVAGLERAARDVEIARAIESGSGVVDLRVPGRVAIRSAESGVPSRSGS